MDVARDRALTHPLYGFLFGGVFVEMDVARDRALTNCSCSYFWSLLLSTWQLWYKPDSKQGFYHHIQFFYIPFIIHHIVVSAFSQNFWTNLTAYLLPSPDAAYEIWLFPCLFRHAYESFFLLIFLFPKLKNKVFIIRSNRFLPTCKINF